MNELTLPNNMFVSKRERTMTLASEDDEIALSTSLQCMRGEKSRRKVSIYKFFNSHIVIGKFTFNNKY